MRKFILGTDWWTDCDDAVALRMLCRAQKRGEIEMVGIIMNGCMEHSLTSLEGFLNTEGMPPIPIGVDLEAGDFGGNPPYQKNLAKYAKRFSKNEEAEDPVRLYRRLLAEAEEPLEFIEVGYMQTIAALLESGPDDISPLSGVELMGKKCSVIWAMAGEWDKEVGHENNFNRNRRTAKGSSILCEKCPVPIIFLGFEVGKTVVSGGKLSHDDPLWVALDDHGSGNGRFSWDPMTILLALIGDIEKAGYRTVRGTAAVDPEDGSNRFTEDPNGLHSYVVKTQPDSWYEDAINALIETGRE